MADPRDRLDTDETRPERKSKDVFFRMNGFRRMEQISLSVELIRIVFCIFVIGLIVAGLIFVFH